MLMNWPDSSGCDAVDQHFGVLPSIELVMSSIRVVFWQDAYCLLAEKEEQRAGMQQQLAEKDEEIAMLRSGRLAGVL